MRFIVLVQALTPELREQEERLRAQTEACAARQP